eukprot:jgi/Hompol1/5439/HPOL_001933-RA
MRMSSLHVPDTIPRPPYDFETGKPLVKLQAPHVNSPVEIEGMRRAGKLAGRILAGAAAIAKPGITTLEIDKFVHEAIIAENAYPSPLGYLQFPRSVCTSINNVICHGVPDERPLKDGDIINIDVTVRSCIRSQVSFWQFHGDTSTTVLVGDVDEPGVALVEATKTALHEALKICGPGVPFREIGSLISNFARSKGYSVNRDFCGHGIGRHFHQPPLVMHHENNEPEVMSEGMTFTVEPILCQGNAGYAKWPDAWTVVTQDGGRSAQFEHTVLVVKDGVEVLTS